MTIVLLIGTIITVFKILLWLGRVATLGEFVTGTKYIGAEERLDIDLCACVECVEKRTLES
jgi:hypothetical protein